MPPRVRTGASPPPCRVEPVEGDLVRVVDFDVRPGVETDMGDGDQGRPSMCGKVAVVAVVAVVGNEDGAHKIVADCFQALNDVGFTIPTGDGTYWNNEAMNPKDYLDLDETPDAVASTNEKPAGNAVHLARLLKQAQYPPVR
ncbi:hypothetical protein [Saccharothrix sp. HUAS TT1]|uniref:hypothetical protein n=1 Tax=unclassified Saccharothrix TaxID=2593673 RepID=UPI00345BC2FD